MKRLISNLFFCLVICYSANAQTIPHLQYGVEEGLGHSIVYDVFQDSKGYMWFGTDRGLSKFDGQHFTNYTTADGLPTNYIISVAETSDNTLWIATYGYGLYKYQNGQFVAHHADNADAPRFINNIVVDNQNRIWIFSRGVKNSAVWYIENDHCKKFNIHAYIKDTACHYVNDVYIKSDGTPLFATDRGAFAFKHNALERLTANMPVYIIDEDIYGNLWFGSDGKVVELSAGGGGRTISNDFIKDKQINVLKADYGNRIWISDNPHCIYVIDADNNKLIFKDNIPVTFFKTDKENNLWAATFGQGVLCYNYPDILNFTLKDGLEDNIISGVAEDNTGIIWVATLNGIDYISSSSSKENSVSTFMKENSVYSFVIDSGNNFICAAGTGGYLEIIKRGIKKQIAVNDHIRELYKDASGKIWIVMDGGIAYYQHDSIHKPKELSALNNTKNHTLILDKEGQLWVGTHDGVYCCKGKVIKQYTVHEGIADNNVEGIWQDSIDRIWFATDAGISILNKGKWVKDSLLQSLNHVVCTSIIGDRKGNIWIGTNNGLYVYNQQRMIRLDTHTGLAGMEVQSLFIDSKSILWVGMIEGLTRIDLKNYAGIMSSYVPDIYIQNVRVNNVFINKYDSASLTLKHFQNNISISYTGLYFKNPRSLLYEYKLSGASDVWRKASGSSVEFSSLSPGSYTFFVRAIGGNGFYSKAPARFSFSILPPYWMRPWFMIIEIFLAIVLISILFRWRLRIYKQRIALKEELLSAKKALEEYTSSMAEKNELLEQFKTDMEALKQLKSKELDEVRVEQLEHLNKTTILTDEDWDKFKRLFESVYKGFFIRLKEKMPDLTQAEMRLVCLTKLKLDTKQMAGILGVSSNTIKISRHRLRKKLGLSEDDSINDIAESI